MTISISNLSFTFHWLLIGMFFVTGIIACDCTYQYGVSVINSTGENINVFYKSINDQNGFIEDSIELKNGETRQIIWTRNIPTEEKCPGTKAEHCKYVADYIRAFIRDTIPSSTNWCDQKIKFQKTDIEQAEFTILYTLDDFPTGVHK